ncbi:MAG: tetraacyldisaccharide 4'-kinase [Candidatus Hydrogenedentes bacterium]|nr:tetraacyldisaccharide 4'-kinase [Candidatus Hydrogenedentota bacterium]
MSFVHRLSEAVRRGENLPLALRALLTTATPITRAGMWLRHRRPKVRVDARVISFGNITAGGTGKTPAVIERAALEMAAGNKVAIVTRGYGSYPADGPVAVTGDGKRDPRLARRLGDEPALMAMRLPGAVIVKSPDRVAGAQLAITKHGCDTIILDDAFQYVQLERDEDIVVIDSTNPFGNGHLIPRGILREPLEALGRATRFVLTHCDKGADPEGLAVTLSEYNPGAPVRMTRHAPKHLWRVRDGKVIDAASLEGRKLVAACAIGNPEAFVRLVREFTGVSTIDAEAFQDHRLLPITVLAAGAEAVIVTDKDAVKMDDSVPDNVYALSIALEDWPATATET